MNPSAHRPSRYFCHPVSLIPALGIQRNYPVNITAYNLVAFSQALRSRRLLPGDLSRYTELFEDADVFIRVVSSHPLQVRTFIPQKNQHDPPFFEYPSQVPSPTYFTRRAILLDKGILACSHCGQTYTCYFYFRKLTSTMTRRSGSCHSQQSECSAKENTTEESKSSPEVGRRGSKRRAVLNLVRRTRKYITRGVKWMELKLKVDSRSLFPVNGLTEDLQPLIKA